MNLLNHSDDLINGFTFAALLFNKSTGFGTTVYKNNLFHYKMILFT
jgi:hypothetical protein